MPTTEAEHDNNNSKQQQQQTWTTWEELLLAFAVKRHGCRNWDTVATELQSRTTKLPHTSPDACRLKFLDLRRRFQNDVVQEEDEDIEDLTVPWVEDLGRRSRRSLQSKVKKLEQDREQSPKEADEKPSDLERSDNNQRDAELSPSNLRAAADGGDDGFESDPDNQSVNGSNSTGPNKAKELGSGREEIKPETLAGSDDKTEPATVQPVSKRNESASTSHDESQSSDSIDKGLSIETKYKNKKGGGGTKTDSDVQSSATLSRKRHRKKEFPGVSVEADDSLRTEESGPLVDILSLVRSHKDASFFDCQLQNQESKMYSNIIRQHMDLQIIQNNLDSGSYASSHLNFFRDLILTFTNNIIFYPKSSPEYKAAQELRAIVVDKMDEQFKQSRRSEEKLSSAPSSPLAKPILERSNSILAKHKPSGSGPIVVCRKRSSISAKGNSNSKGEQHQGGDEMKTVALADLKLSPVEDRGLLSSKTKDRIVTGTRSLRRSNTSLKKPLTLPNAAAAATTSNSNKKETTTTTEATTTTATEKKKEESSASNSAKKRGAADFLKRLEGNSPVKSKDVKGSATKGNSSTTGGEQKKKNENGDKVDGRRKITTRQTDQDEQTLKNEGSGSPNKRNVGRPSKKTLESATTVVKRARDAEASASGGSKQPKKRTRR